MKKLKFIIPLLALLLASPAWAAVTFDAVATATAINASTLNWDLTIGGGCTNRIVIVNVGFQHATVGSVSSITVGGSGATLIDAQNTAGADRRIEKWYFVNPGTGLVSVAVTLDATKNSITGTARSYCGVHQTTSLGMAAKATSTEATATVDVPSAIGELVVDAVHYSSGATDTMTVGSGQTQRSNFFQDQANHTHATSEEIGASSVTMSWTLTTANYWAIVGVSLKPSGAATPRRRAAPFFFP